MEALRVGGNVSEGGSVDFHVLRGASVFLLTNHFSLITIHRSSSFQLQAPNSPLVAHPCDRFSTLLRKTGQKPVF